MIDFIKKYWAFILAGLAFLAGMILRGGGKFGPSPQEKIETETKAGEEAINADVDKKAGDPSAITNDLNKRFGSG